MKKISIVAILAIWMCNVSFGQSSAKIIYAELGGPGIASFNYDMRLMKKHDGLGFRVGFGGFKIEGEGLTTIPVGVNYLLGKDGKNYFELGAGWTYLSLSGISSSGDVFESSFGILTLGYRMAPTRGGFVFKAAITPVFGKGYFIPYYAGVGFGYKF